jgi:hypothetical protein
MPIKPSQMQAWLAGVGEPQVGQGQLAALTRRPKSKIDGQSVEEHEATEPEAEAQAEQGVEEKYPTLFPMLEANGEMLDELAATLNQDLLLDAGASFEDDEEELLLAALEQLPQEMLDAMAEELAEATPDDMDAIAAALMAGEHITDQDAISGFLVHGAPRASTVVSVQESEEPAEEEVEVEAEVDPALAEEIVEG